MFLAPAESLSKVQGRPFLVSEIEDKIEQMLAEPRKKHSVTMNVEGGLVGDFVDDAAAPGPEKS